MVLKFLYSNFKKGVEKVKSNPQLIYTIIVALLIIGSFIFMSERFIGIANDAQERLVNVRVGSLQDAFVSFAGEKINDPAYLNNKIDYIISANETIKNFKVVTKKTNKYVVLASNDESEINQNDEEVSLLYNLATGDPAHSVTIAASDGGERFFKTARAITDSAGNVLGVVVTTQTLSLADQMIERNIAKSRLLLILIIVITMFLFLRLSRIIDYIDLYKKLKSVDQLKDDFISMASHELRTPLTVIRGYAEFIRQAPELRAETKEHASKIGTSARDLDALVSDILDVSRIEQGRLAFNLEKINPSSIIEEVVSSLSASATEKGLRLSFDKSGIGENQYLYADKDRLKQVLVNLVGNAVKYTKGGEITVKQYQENGLLRILIKDTGIGMSEEEKAKLFEKFYRIRTGETQEIRGTGLGLWITNQMVKEMKGKISVESIKGVGSHFIVSFPVIS